MVLGSDCPLGPNSDCKLVLQPLTPQLLSTYKVISKIWRAYGPVILPVKTMDYIQIYWDWTYVETIDFFPSMDLTIL